jgi:hypothetical protein
MGKERPPTPSKLSTLLRGDESRMIARERSEDGL